MKAIDTICVGACALALLGGAANAAASCATQETLFHVEYLGACGYEQSDSFTLASSSYVTKIRIWYDASRVPGSLAATLTGPGVSMNQTTEKGGCYAGWCEGNFIVNAVLGAGTYTVNASSPYVCDNPGGASTLVVYGCAAASGGQAFDVAARASGDTSALSLALDLKVASADVGTSGGIYLGARVPLAAGAEQWFINNGSDWTPMGAAIPAYYSGALPDSRTLTVLSGSDVRALGNTEIYAGYGANASDMLARGLIKLAYTIPASTLPSGNNEVKGYIDTMMGMVGTTLSGGLTAQLQPLLTAVLNDTPTTCPAVTKNFNLAGLSSIDAFLASLPNPVVATVDYGAGCTPASGGSMSGQATLQVADLAINADAGTVSGRVTLAANMLKKDGAILADGTMSGGFAGAFANGLTGSGDIALSNFMLPGGIRTSGSVTVNVQSADAYLFGISLADSNNVNTNLNLVVQKSGADYLINTASPGSVNQYAVTLTQVRMNTDVCPNYPIGGTATFGSGGQTWTATFDGSCNGTYTLR